MNLLRLCTWDDEGPTSMTIAQRLIRVSAGGLLLLPAVIVPILLLQPGPRTIPAPDESQVELALEHEGTAYKLIRGDLYKAGPDPSRLTFVEALYDPVFFTKNYVVVEGKPHKKDPETGRLYPTRRHFEEGFEDAEKLTDLIGPQRDWTTFTLQSPLAPTIPEY
jgi:hypothetical protein